MMYNISQGGARVSGRFPCEEWKRTDVRAGHQAVLDDISRRRCAQAPFHASAPYNKEDELDE